MNTKFLFGFIVLALLAVGLVLANPPTAPSSPSLPDSYVSYPTIPSLPEAITGTSSCIPTNEICDGFDNDCDGQIDENNVCVATCEPTTEMCSDGLDNDCDGQIDESGCKKQSSGRGGSSGKGKSSTDTTVSTDETTSFTTEETPDEVAVVVPKDETEQKNKGIKSLTWKVEGDTLSLSDFSDVSYSLEEVTVQGVEVASVSGSYVQLSTSPTAIPIDDYIFYEQYDFAGDVNLVTIPYFRLDFTVDDVWLVENNPESILVLNYKEGVITEHAVSFNVNTGVYTAVLENSEIGSLIIVGKPQQSLTPISDVAKGGSSNILWLLLVVLLFVGVILGGEHLMHKRKMQNLRSDVAKEAVVLNEKENDLLDYIKRQQAHGFSDAVVKKAVLHSGWSEEEADKVLEVSHRKTE